MAFVAPVKDYGDNLNDWSAVVRLDYGSASFLFTGDAEEQAEKDMISTGQNIRNVDVLKVGHHGSDTSTSQAFLDAVNPDYAVISVGKGNTSRPSVSDGIEPLGQCRCESVPDR